MYIHNEYDGIKMINQCYFPSIEGNSFVKNNLINELQELSERVVKDSFIVGFYNGLPIYADKVEIETADFIELS